MDRVGWLPRDKYLVTDLSECTSVLVYVVDLVRPGSVSFTYQYSDDTLLFMFEVFENLKKTSKLKRLLFSCGVFCDIEKQGFFISILCFL